MESYGGGGTRTSASSRRPCTSASPRRPSTAAAASRAGSGAFAYDGMRATPLSTSTANFTRSLRKAVSFAHNHKKPPPSAADAPAPPPRRALSSKENSAASTTEAVLMSPHRRSMPEPGAAASGPWEPTTRRRRSTGTVDEAAGAGKGSSSAAASGALLRETMSPRRKEEPEKDEAAHRARMLTARLLQWRFANARMEKAMARATSAAEVSHAMPCHAASSARNATRSIAWFLKSDGHCRAGARVRACMQNKLFYTWLRVAELRNIQAAKRIVAQRRRQKLKLARLLRPQLPLLASWEPLAKPHADATADLGRVLSAACTGVPLAAGARADDMDALHETMFSCVGTVNEIEAITATFYATVRTYITHTHHENVTQPVRTTNSGRL